MRLALLIVPLLMACAHRPTVVRSVNSGSSEPLLGTWRGALDTHPVILRVYGSDEDGLHAEMQVDHEGAAQHWILLAKPDDSTSLTFAASAGVPVCSAEMDRNRLMGTCELEPGGRKRQWLVVRL